MKFCDSIYCETPDEPIERVSDYRIVEGSVVCVHCYELEQDAPMNEDSQCDGDTDSLGQDW